MLDGAFVDLDLKTTAQRGWCHRVAPSDVSRSMAGRVPFGMAHGDERPEVGSMTFYGPESFREAASQAA